MTKKHYALIAATLAALRPDENLPAYDIWFREIEALAHKLRAENPRFDYTLFLRATGAL